MDTFKIRVYGMQELAQLYFPHNAPRSASNQLKKWMNKAMLKEKLRECDYRDGQKILTPRQVGIIIEHIGEP